MPGNGRPSLPDLLVGEGGRVYAFEPIPHYAQILRDIAAATGSTQWHVIEKALCSANGTIDFHWIKGAPGYSGIRRRQAPNEAEGVEKLTVAATTIDSFAEGAGLPGLHFIKLDLEGGEYHALRGARETLRRFRPVVVFESGSEGMATLYGYTRDDFFSLFDEVGYTVFDLFGQPFGREEWGKDSYAYYFIAMATEGPGREILDVTLPTLMRDFRSNPVMFSEIVFYPTALAAPSVAPPTTPVAASAAPSVDGRLDVIDAAREDEISYWREIFSNRERDGDRYIDALLDPNHPIQPELEAILRSYVGAAETRLRVLDVGCGPLSVLGKKGQFSEFEIVGVDPLASEYRSLLAGYGLSAPHEILAGKGEGLQALFPRESFDFIYSRNALDHCEDPRLVLRNMVALVKPNAKIFINVCQNEAENSAYTGFRRWNFDTLSDQVLVWNPGTVEFLDFIVGGHPYEFDQRNIGTDKKFQGQIDITIHKNSLDPLGMQQVANGLYAAFSRRHGWITLIAEAPVDEQYSFFVHGIERGTMLYSCALRWYNHRPVRSVTLPKGKFSSVKVGQYYRDHMSKGQRYVNLWETTIDSMD